MRWIAVTSSHGIMEGFEHPEFRQILESATLSVPDGKWTARAAAARLSLQRPPLAPPQGPISSLRSVVADQVLIGPERSYPTFAALRNLTYRRGLALLPRAVGMHELLKSAYFRLAAPRERVRVKVAGASAVFFVRAPSELRMLERAVEVKTLLEPSCEFLGCEVHPHALPPGVTTEHPALRPSHFESPSALADPPAVRNSIPGTLI
jgi:hypothetical protein